MEPTASPKVGGSSDSAPKQGCLLPSAPIGAHTVSAWLKLTHFTGEGKVSGSDLHRQSTLAFAPAFAASPRLQRLHWDWESVLMLPRSSMSRKVTREVGQGRLGCWTMGPKREELGPAGCWCGAGCDVPTPHTTPLKLDRGTGTWVAEVWG